jgi:uncharacterized membrane protein
LAAQLAITSKKSPNLVGIGLLSLPLFFLSWVFLSQLIHLVLLHFNCGKALADALGKTIYFLGGITSVIWIIVYYAAYYDTEEIGKGLSKTEKLKICISLSGFFAFLSTIVFFRMGTIEWLILVSLWSFWGLGLGFLINKTLENGGWR